MARRCMSPGLTARSENPPGVDQSKLGVDATRVSVPAPARTIADAGCDSDRSLYTEFRRQWRSNFGTDEMKRKDVEKALGLVPGQVKKWLERAEQDGWIRRTSKSPARFALSGEQKSLL